MRSAPHLFWRPLHDASQFLRFDIAGDVEEASRDGRFPIPSRTVPRKIPG